ncbi:parvulin-like peptidyl-prolyl isomerase [Leptolyngbyaceae cyanobacterium JSC-12]|nr:parvulin-like peptidyl-prolyl isomerase [Leptolyngbyaceae cyanobacterium JSC-12]
MSNCLKIGHRWLDGDQIISALVRYKLLEPLVGQLLLDDVIQEFPLTKEELFPILTGEADAPIPDDFESFVKQWCHYKGVTLEYFKAVMLRELQLEKFKQLQFGERVESEFLRIKSDLDQVEYSLIQLRDLVLAQELYFQLRDDEACFAELAQYYSLGPERETGGWIGPVPLSTLPVEVASLFRNEHVGTVYGPIPVADSFWVVRLERFTAARLTEATRTQIIHRLYSQWLQTQIRTATKTPGMIAVLPASANMELASEKSG